jgi:hypothetical protein
MARTMRNVETSAPGLLDVTALVRGNGPSRCVMRRRAFADDAAPRDRLAVAFGASQGGMTIGLQAVENNVGARKLFRSLDIFLILILYISIIV